jgi:pyrroloquinoline quinone biosynthesis protein B
VPACFLVRIRVLGSAAGGGFPQWNCNCPNCRGYRSGTLRALGRTQSSIAVSGDAPTVPGSRPAHSGGDPAAAQPQVLAHSAHSGKNAARWILVNASPDILAQLRANPDLQPGRTLRDSALGAVLLVDGQVDHTTGLYMLREATAPWPVWCTDSTYADLTQGNPVLQVLGHFCGVERRRIELDREFAMDEAPGIRWRALPVASKPAPYSPNRESPVPGDNIALVISDDSTGRSVVYAPGLGSIDERLWQFMRTASCVMVDGTFWSDDEMVRVGVSKKRARDLGHLPQSGEGGMLEWLDRLPMGVRKVLIHINNTNPILDELSVEYGELKDRGVEVAYDGLEISL